MDAGINNVIYMELHLGPKMANSTCGKTIVAGTIDRGSTVNGKMKYKKCNFLPVFAVVRTASVAVAIVATAATTIVFC